MVMALIVWGVYSVRHLPIDAVPDITNNQVQVISQAPSLGTQEVEQFITAPIELAMANIPHVVERRSISRSGISVITIVFEDDADIYWARQQVAAQLQEAEASIPRGLARPALAPVTTGLGEIYQYVLHAKKGYENKYSATDLRTLQDWVVRTQLAGTKGVAEVSGWGGYVKQYEIALDNEKLNASNVTIAEIYEALEQNNESTGGSYIEQQSNAYAIRGLGQVRSLDDIEKIVVKTTGGVPLLIRDIGVVQFGSATRYGAVTRNGTGEVVAGITLMLKGENFNEVIGNVKERIAQIQRSLPEGVVIEPFIDRTELVGRAIGTVQKNLTEGALIVIFVLLLLLGNWRAGLIVASVIPLAMLFAFAMMRLFGVSGNLMSLGAIDFGLIVDGAVIIVEAIIFRLTESRLFKGNVLPDQSRMDEEVFTAASRIRNSAAFGEVIILIVYLPLLSLSGIEGKMFKPMAQTVAFAIAGAFLLSLTYVPMASALFLSKKRQQHTRISERIMDVLKRVYRPLLQAVLRSRRLVIAGAASVFVLTLWLFLRMGGEFLPQLEEGDLTVEIAMAQGTSLSQVVQTFSKAEKILKEKFPEVKQVVTRIGSAEIPTDPMPMERGDMMVAMLPKDNWRTAHSREEMSEKMEEALSVLPGINVEITQPMQMRFNELMTGIRQDVAVKIYGEDLEVLTRQARKVAALIAPVAGVGTPFVEQVTGLPQIVVNYDRDKIAQYGLTIGGINTILRTAFAGGVAGVVFEGEKRFDLVLRLQRDLREDITNIENLYIPLPSGNKVPLSQVARVAFRDAPAQISREEGKRRIYIGFNVRERDVESTVADIRQVLDAKLKLPPGYYLTYGGQFQHLKEARSRLSVAVPLSLGLILGLLYFTFRSLKQTILIFTAVPLAAIGGVFALLLRGMPFSISAGVGFIALFGVAVLNGMVLISYFNQLKAEGVSDVCERVMRGTAVRLRPVILTAAVASLGFLPMALSGGAGAEVQKPLATVVIGGLLSATLLTLFVLPCLYVLFYPEERRGPEILNNGGKGLKKGSVICLAALLLGTVNVRGQEVVKVSADTAVAIALRNNLELRSSVLLVSQSTAMEKSAFDPGKTALNFSQDPSGGGSNDNSLGISQNFAWPALYRNQKKVLAAQTGLAARREAYTRKDIVKEVKQAYYNCLYGLNVVKVLELQDSIYRYFVQKAELRYQTGETSRLELITAKNKYQEVLAEKRGVLADLAACQLSLQQLLNTDNKVLPADEILPLLSEPGEQHADKNPALGIYEQQVLLAKTKISLERSKAMPDFTIGYAQQLVIRSFDPANLGRDYTPGTRIAGIQLGIGIPLFNGAGRARVKNEQIGLRIAETDYLRKEKELALAYQLELQNYAKYKAMAGYYLSGGLEQSAEQIRIARISYDLGEIGYMEFIQNMGLAIEGRLNYLQNVQQLNQSVIQLEFLKEN